MSFYIQNRQTDGINSNQKGFGAVQDMQKKQEERAVKEKEKEKNIRYSLEEDTVTISDKAKLLNSQLDSEDTDGITKLRNMVDQFDERVGAAIAEQQEEEAILEVESVEEVEEADYTITGKEVEGKGDKEASPVEAQVEALEKQIKAKEAELQELMKNGSEEAKAKAQMLQAEIATLRNMMSELQSQEE